MSFIDSYTCVNYFMSVLLVNIFSSKFDCRPRPLYRPCMCMLYLLVLCNVIVLIYVCFQLNINLLVVLGL